MADQTVIRLRLPARSTGRGSAKDSQAAPCLPVDWGEDLRAAGARPAIQDHRLSDPDRPARVAGTGAGTVLRVTTEGTMHSLLQRAPLNLPDDAVMAEHRTPIRRADDSSQASPNAQLAGLLDGESIGAGGS